MELQQYLFPFQSTWWPSNTTMINSSMFFKLKSRGLYDRRGSLATALLCVRMSDVSSTVLCFLLDAYTLVNELSLASRLPALRKGQGGSFF